MKTDLLIIYDILINNDLLLSAFSNNSSNNKSEKPIMFAFWVRIIKLYILLWM